MPVIDAADLLAEYDLARAHTRRLSDDLTDDEVRWRPHADSSAIGWHLGHQAAVSHVMVRNLLAAEASLDPALEALFDSATPEPGRGDLPDAATIAAYRHAVVARVHAIAERVLEGRVGAPAQLRRVLAVVLTALVNHEYQHDAWIDEMRVALGRAPGPRPESARVEAVEGYWVVRTPTDLG